MKNRTARPAARTASHPIPVRSRGVTDAQANDIAARCAEGYSVDRYKLGFGPCARMMAKRGFDPNEIEAVLLSKWTRWAADAANKYHDATAADLARFLDTQTLAALDALVAEHFEGNESNMWGGAR